MMLGEILMEGICRRLKGLNLMRGAGSGLLWGEVGGDGDACR